jgi:hypothetical protein
MLITNPTKAISLIVTSEEANILRSALGDYRGPFGTGYEKGKNKDDDEHVDKCMRIANDMFLIISIELEAQYHNQNGG